jgi:hypothetical protein
MRQFGRLYRIDFNECITSEKHFDFLYHIQLSLLLGLKDLERLDMMQYRHAEEKLKQQRQDRAKAIRKMESNDD